MVLQRATRVARSVVKPLVARETYVLYNCTRTEDGWYDERSCYVPFWYTRTGVIVKWSIFWGFTLLLFLYFTIGYIHAKKRIRKGLLPLPYHRWQVSRAQLAQVDPAYAYPPPPTYMPYYPNQQYYGMHGMHPMPPPVYDPNSRPPMYDAQQPKVDPSQVRTAEHAPQSGLPPRLS